MSNYEQMELNITLDGERELKENVMLSVEFVYDQLKSYDLPNVANRYEGYGIAANMWSQLAAKEKGVKDSMKHFLVTLDIGEQAAIEAASSLYNSVTEVVYTATNMAAHVNKVMNDLFKVYSEIEEETPIEKMIEDGNDDGFEEAEEKTEENTEAEAQNKEKISSKIKGIKFVMDNGEEKYQKGSFVFGCAISIEDSHCESFMIGECPGGATQIVIDMAESNARLINAAAEGDKEKYTKMMQSLMEVIRFKMFNGADARL